MTNLDFPELAYEDRSASVAVQPLLRASHYAWLALAILALALYGSLVPFRFKSQTLSEAWTVFHNITLAPPADLAFRADWVITFLLFTVASFFCMGMLSVDRPRSDGLRAAPLIVLLFAGLSVLVEWLQVFFPPRTISVNDLYLQAAGGLSGTIVWLVGGRRITRWARRLGAATGLPGLAGRLWSAYLVLLLVVQLMPFDFTVNTTELAAKYHQGRIALVPFVTVPDKELTELFGKLFIHGLCFAPLGFLHVLSRKRDRAPADWLEFLALALGIPTLIEGLQVLVFSRFCDTTDIVIGAAAVAVGWYAADVFVAYWSDSLGKPNMSIRPQWHPAVWAGVTLAWLGVILYFHWNPFDFTADPARFRGDAEDFPQVGLRRFAWLPLVDYYWGSKYNLLDQFLRKTLSFVPIGVLITLGRDKLYQRGTAWLVAGTALTIAALVEAGSYFLPGRTPSTTDAVFACFGAWIGHIMTQHVRVVFWAERQLFGLLRHPRF